MDGSLSGDGSTAPGTFYLFIYFLHNAELHPVVCCLFFFLTMTRLHRIIHTPYEQFY